MNSVTFGKRRYHEHPDMEKWCHENIGKGGWTWETPKTWEGMNEQVWVVHSMFGNTTFAFKNQRDYTMFILRWL